MKKKTAITCILLLIVIILAFARCMPTKVIQGEISHISGNVVTVQGYQFKCDTSGLFVGKWVSFTPSVNRKIINSKKLN